MNVFGWNAVGHRLIAQIAYDHMTLHTKQVCNQYNRALDKVYKPQSLIQAAVWLDTLRYQDISWFAVMHYVDIPFSVDESPLPVLAEINALWAIEKATNLLLNKYPTDFDKGIALRVLSAAYPEGDRGGNLVPLPDNPVANNLHAYWDRGAGLLNAKKHYSQTQMTELSARIEQLWPCEVTSIDINPKKWANESHELAVKNAYQWPINNNYQEKAQRISEQRIALAGCRLAALLNKIDDDLSNQSSVKRQYRHMRTRRSH